MKYQENKKYIKIGITAISVIAGGLICYFLLFRHRELAARLKTVTDILSPFIWGALFAYVLTPVCNRTEKILLRIFHPSKGESKIIKAVAIAISLLLIIALLLFLIILVIPQVWESIISIVNAIPEQLATVNSRVHNLLKSQPELQSYWDEFYNMAENGITEWLKTNWLNSDWIKNDLLSTMETVINGVGSGLAVFFTFIKNLLLGILISAYFLANRKQFTVQSKMLLNAVFPQHWADLVEEEVRFADKMFNGFLMGKLLDSAIIGIICFIVTALMGFKSAVLISVIVGVTNIIPFFGPFIGAVPCAFLLLLDNPMHCLYFLIFIVILQQVDGNIIGPKILGNTTGLPSFWVLFSILLFGGLWGIFGMIVGVPLFAIIYDIVRRLTIHGINKHERTELIEEYENTFYPKTEVKKDKETKQKLSSESRHKKQNQ